MHGGELPSVHVQTRKSQKPMSWGWGWDTHLPVLTHSHMHLEAGLSLALTSTLDFREPAALPSSGN